MQILGINLDQNGRCAHYNSKLDIVAIKFKCCHHYYACYHCHEELVKHDMIKWEKTDYQELAILCGNCNEKITIKQYQNAASCLHCNAKFNPKCENHYSYYFETS